MRQRQHATLHRGEPPPPVIPWSSWKGIAVYLFVILFLFDYNKNSRFSVIKQYLTSLSYLLPITILSSSTWQRRAAAPGHTLKWQKKCCGVPLRNAFYLITILLIIKNNLVKQYLTSLSYLLSITILSSSNWQVYWNSVTKKIPLSSSTWQTAANCRELSKENLRTFFSAILCL